VHWGRSMESDPVAGSINAGCPAWCLIFVGLPTKKTPPARTIGRLLFDCYSRPPRRGVSDDSGMRISAVGNQFDHLRRTVLMARDQESARRLRIGKQMTPPFSNPGRQIDALRIACPVSNRGAGHEIPLREMFRLAQKRKVAKADGKGDV
jgi:hypothetical protein